MISTRLSRRNVLQIVALGGAATTFGWWLRSPRTTKVERAASLMGTSVRFTVISDDRELATAAADSALGVMATLDARLSRFRHDSEVGRLNRLGRIDDASDELLNQLDLSARIARLGDGAFDITVLPLLDVYAGLADPTTAEARATLETAAALVDYRSVRVDGRSVALERPGMRITLDGVAKGYIVDQAVEALRRHGFANVYVEAGGDLMAAGQKTGAAPWNIGIRHPRSMSMIAGVELRDRAIATSGDYMQAYTRDFARHHIIDPRLRGSSPDLASATVIAPDAATADALATTAMALGLQRGRALLEDLPDVEGFLVTKSMETVRTTGFTVI